MTTNACEKKCEFCDKRGLPVMPVRYAIAPDNIRAPKLSSALKDSGGTAFPLGGEMQYTRRLLRSGYLYVFDEARNRWEAYFVTSGAYFIRFDVDKPMPTAYGERVPCDCAGHQEVASCITIADPKNATTVWFGFSDVEWTPEVLNKHASADYRKQHMQMLDVGIALAGGKQDYVKPISRLGETIAEYALAPAEGNRAFANAPFPYQARQPQCAQVIRAADLLRPGKGVIIGLFDPAGVAAELAANMSARYNKFIGDPRYKWPLAVSDAIVSLKAGIQHQAELDELNAAQYVQGQVAQSPGLWLTASGRKMIEEAGKVSAADLENVDKHSWDKYVVKYNEKARSDFRKTFDEALQKFDDEQLAPLAQAHAAWMSSTRMANYFICNFDESDPHSGLVYLETLSMCIGATQDKKACFDIYAKWLGGSVTDRHNLLLRGLVLNQKTIAEIIAKGAANSTDPRSLPWDAMIGNFGKTTESILLHKPDALGKLIVQVTGPLTKIARQFAEAGALPHALIAAGVVSKTPILRIELEDTLEKFQRHVVEELLKAKGETTNRPKLKMAVERELKLLNIKGTPLHGKQKMKFLVLADLDIVESAPRSGEKMMRATALSKALVNIDDLEKIELGRWRKVLAKGTMVTEKVSPLAFSAVGAMLQLLALSSLSEELDKASQSGKNPGQAFARYTAGCAALTGTVAEALGTAIEKFPGMTLKLGKVVGKYLSETLKFAGKTLGVFGAVIVAICDIDNALQARSEGKKGLALAYSFSAALGLGGALLMLSSAAMATGIGLIVVLLAIGLSFLIDYLKDNPIQNWLESGYFNKGTFPTVDVELAKLKAIGD
jgi:hypothetical protein